MINFTTLQAAQNKLVIAQYLQDMSMWREAIAAMKAAVELNPDQAKLLGRVLVIKG